MKKKIFLVFIMFMLVITLTGCTSKSAIDFKNEYEALNGKENKSGKIHRTVEISKNNPYVKVTPDEIVKMINNKETFYLYVGDALCPWCRSAIEKSIEVANKNNIKKIYYIEIWDDEGNEILRDKYEIQDGQVVKTIEGTTQYYELLKSFDSLLSSYTLTNDKGEKVDVGVKRIYAPNFFYVEKGEVKKLIQGYSSLQKDAREELTKEMLEDEEKQFNDLFNN